MKRSTVLLVFALAAVSHASAQVSLYAEEVKHLNQRYQSGGIYLSYSSLNAFHAHLADSGRRLYFEKMPVPMPVVVDRLTTYLKQIAPGWQEQLNTATAFVHVDFANGRVVAKKMDDLQGGGQPVPLSKDEVLVLAVLCDSLLSRSAELQAKAASIQSTALTPSKISEVWRGLGAVEADPYVVPAARLSYLTAVKDRLNAASETQLEALKIEDAKTYAEISSFRSSNLALEAATREVIRQNTPFSTGITRSFITPADQVQGQLFTRNYNVAVKPIEQASARLLVDNYKAATSLTKYDKEDQIQKLAQAVQRQSEVTRASATGMNLLSQ